MGLVPGGPAAGTKVGEEFATPSVNSPGLEEALSLPPQQVEAIFKGVVDDLRWMDASKRGFLKMTFTTSEAKGEWVFVNTVKSQTYTAAVGYTARYLA
jgi:alkaline phosphatase D